MSTFQSTRRLYAASAVACVLAFGASTSIGQSAAEVFSEDSKAGLKSTADTAGGGIGLVAGVGTEAIRLRLSSDRFAPSRAVKLRIEIHVPSFHLDRPLTLVREVIRVHDSEVIDQADYVVAASPGGAVARLVDEFVSPSESGVYEIRCRLQAPSERLWLQLRGKTQLIASAGEPMVVESPDAESAAGELGWSNLVEVRPCDGLPWPFEQWLPRSGSRLLPDAPPLSWSDLEQHGDLGKTVIDGQTLTTIRPARTFKLTLPRGHSGRLHRIRLRYPAGVRNHFRLETVDSRSGAEIARLGEIVEPEGVEAFERKAWRDVWVNYYPGAGGETLCLRNLSVDADAVLDSVRVDVASYSSGSVPRRSRRSAAGRLAVRLDRPDWASEITRGLERDARFRAFGGSTRAVYRSRLGVERLRDLLLAGEYGKLVVGFEPSLDQRRMFDRVVARAGVQVDYRGAVSKGRTPDAEVRRPDSGTTLRWPESQSTTPHQVARQLVRRLVGAATSEIQVSVARLVSPVSTEELQLRRSFLALPAGRLGPVECIRVTNQTKDISSLNGGERLWVRLVNLSVWESRVQLVASGVPAELTWPGLGPKGVDRLELEQLDLESGEALVALTMQPGQFLVLDFGEASHRVLAWDSQPAGGAIAADRIKQQVTKVVERLGMLTELPSSGSLTNPSFEDSGVVGLVGWLHSQHPQDSFAIDTSTAFTGKRSVRLRNTPSVTSPAWLVSEPLPVPASGRIAVSMAVRGDESLEDAPHKIRVAVEGVATGEPFRHSAEVLVPSSGNWNDRKIVLEADQLTGIASGQLRLAIDSLSSGSVWIDGIQVHDAFPLQRERDVLQSLAFLAVQGLQRGDLTPASRLLSKYWSQHLLSLPEIPNTGPGLGSESPSGGSSDSDRLEVGSSPQGLTNKLKSWVPESLRF